DVVVDVPRIAPEIVASESDTSARPALGNLLSLIKFACEATPTSVPAVSKKSTKRNVNTTTKNCKLKISAGFLNPSKAAPKVGAILGTLLTIASGIGSSPNKSPDIAVTIIPIKIAAG